MQTFNYCCIILLEWQVVELLIEHVNKSVLSFVLNGKHNNMTFINHSSFDPHHSLEFWSVSWWWVEWVVKMADFMCLYIPLIKTEIIKHGIGSTRFYSIITSIIINWLHCFFYIIYIQFELISHSSIVDSCQLSRLLARVCMFVCRHIQCLQGWCTWTG